MRRFLRGLKDNAIILLIITDVIIGLWFATIYLYIFTVIINGGTAFGEPDSVVARWEFGLSIFTTCWFLWQVPFWIIRAVKKHIKNEGVD